MPDSCGQLVLFFLLLTESSFLFRGDEQLGAPSLPAGH